MQSRFLYIFMVIFAVVALAFGAGHGLVRHIAYGTGTHSETQLLVIEAGDSVSSVAKQAVALGFVRQAWHFKLVTRWRGLDRALYAGEYEILPGASLYEVLSRIEYHHTYKRRFVVPEGASVIEVEVLMRDSVGLNMNGYTRPPEGSLLPETYYYERGDTASGLVARMQTAMNDTVEQLWRSRAGNLPYTNSHEAIILASIVEKETALANERDLVAAVFVNRLRQGMRLQSDPTVIYGLSGGAPLGRGLTRGDLRSDTPFNSYRRGGLPPTPIANPGRASIAAVLNPANAPYLYFVADGTGGHAFANTLEDHNRNVARWRHLEKNLP